MSTAQLVAQDAIPSEYKTITKKLAAALKKNGGKGEHALLLEFAKVMGVSLNMDDIASVETARRLDAEKHALEHFRNNVELLVQKTWVEKADEALKEKLIDHLPDFIGQLQNSRYADAVRTFSSIADELAYLLFGTQSRKADFIEYAFRIDGQIGLFWWYTSTLESMADAVAPQMLRLMVFVGVAYVASL